MYTKDVTVIYQGGSGGFALYYHLLLTGNFQIDATQAQSMIAHQFPNKLINDPREWKKTELWPKNTKTKESLHPQLFLICNPLFNSAMYKTNQSICNNTHKILLYTDIHVQLRLAWEKQAYWFTQVSRQHFNAPDNEKQYFRQIINSAVDYNGLLVDPMIPEIIDHFKPDQIIRLESLLTNRTNFLTYWLSLQPKKAQRLISQYSGFTNSGKVVCQSVERR